MSKMTYQGFEVEIQSRIEKARKEERQKYVKGMACLASYILYYQMKEQEKERENENSQNEQSP